MKLLVVRKPFRNLPVVILVVIGLMAVPASEAWARPADAFAGQPSVVTRVLDVAFQVWSFLGRLAGNGGDGLSNAPAPDGSGGSGTSLPPPPGGNGWTTNGGGGDCAHANDPDGCSG